MPELEHRADVLIVGAGPSGLAAAIELRRRGIDEVVVLERDLDAGGVPRHCAHYPFGVREWQRLLTGPAYAARLVEQAIAAGVTLLTGVSVTGLRPGPCVSVTSAAGPALWRAERVLIGTGGRERSRSARLLGGTRPGGVLSTGALQSLVHLKGYRPFCKPVILGTELVALSAIMTCRHHDIRPVAMIEPGSRMVAFAASRGFPPLMRVPLYLNTVLESIEGQHQVHAVVLRRADGSRQHIETDGVIVSGQFQPDAALLHGSSITLDPATGGPVVDQYARCTDPDYFATGNVLRAVESAGWCWREGRAVGQAIARSLTSGLPVAGHPVSVSVSGPGLRYVVPQRLARQTDRPALPGLQLRVDRPVNARLDVMCDGQSIISRSIRSRPERRVLVPLPPVTASTGAALTLRLREN